MTWRHRCAHAPVRLARIRIELGHCGHHPRRTVVWQCSASPWPPVQSLPPAGWRRQSRLCRTRLDELLKSF